MPSTPPASERLPLREKLCYGFGDLASCLYWQTFMMYLIYYYTDVFGISALAAAVLLGPSRFIDAFFDPFVGLVADRTQTRWGKYRPFLLWVCVPFAAVGVLTFTTPGAATARHLDAALGGEVRLALGLLVHGGGGLAHLGRSLHWGWLSGASGGLVASADALRHQVAGRLVWALLTYNGLMLLYTTINIPYTAMLGVMTPNPRERTSLSSIKFVGAYLGGNILISFGLLKLVQVLGGADAAAGWQRAFLVIGAVAIACFVITFANTRERVRPPPAQRTSVGRDLRDLVTNGPWLLLLATTLAFILFVAARSSVTVHYFKYYVGDHVLTFPGWMPVIGGTQTWQFGGLVSLYNGTGGIASLLGLLGLPWLVNRAGKKSVFIVLFVISIASTAAFYFLRPGQIGLIFGLNLAGSVTGGPLSALLWAMYADTADFGEWRRGRRATGLVFSASILSQKMGWAFGGTLALLLMSSVGFQANAVQTPGSLRGLVLLMSLIPAAFGFIALVLVACYPLGEARMGQIAADLKSRRLAEEPAAAAAPL